MGRQRSSIDLLPQEVRDQLNAFLRDPAITQKEATERVNALLEEIGVKKKVSKSSVNRYAMQMEEIGAQLRESREIAKMWIGELGAEPQGKIGNLVNEMLRTIAFRLSMLTQGSEIDEKNAGEIAKIGKDLSLMMMRLEKAANLNVEREREIRQQALVEAAETAEKITKQGGLSAETAEQIRKGILGLT